MEDKSLYAKVITEFKENNLSVIQISEKLNISIVKVRRILITEGLWHSRSSDEIGKLYAENRTVKQIADELHMSEKNVQAYLPYSRGLYGLDERTDSAVWSDKFRKRNKRVAEKQIITATKTNANIKREEELKMDKDKIAKIPPSMMKLHIELNIENTLDEDKEILKKYGKVKNGLSRDILTPADITLYALHYVIQRLFGWQNSHLHHFGLPDNVFEKITENKVKTWSKLCGIYFRFPDEDYEDRYWDSDYDDSIAFKSWLKRKYKGPYTYGGMGDYYYENQEKYLELRKNFPEFEVRQSFQDFMAKKPDLHKRVRLENATLDELERTIVFGAQFNSLLERLFVVDYLFMPNRKYEVLSDVAKDRVEFLQKDIKNNMRTWKNVLNKLPESKETYGMMVNFSTLRLQPITDELVYEYDYGDGWNVSIKCEEAYYNKHYAPFESQKEVEYVDSEGQNIDESTLADIEKVLLCHSPICLNADGVNVLDDVGGIGGFADFLRTIHESKNEDEKDEMREWARSLGWTGRNTKPQNRL